MTVRSVSMRLHWWAALGVAAALLLLPLVRPAAADDEPKQDDSYAPTFREKLEYKIDMPFENPTPLEDVIGYVKSATKGPRDRGIPIRVDREGVERAGRSLGSLITLNTEGVPLKTSLKQLLDQVGLTYTVEHGVLTITAPRPKK